MKERVPKAVGNFVVVEKDLEVREFVMVLTMGVVEPVVTARWFGKVVGILYFLEPDVELGSVLVE